MTHTIAATCGAFWTRRASGGVTDREAFCAWLQKLFMPRWSDLFESRAAYGFWGAMFAALLSPNGVPNLRGIFATARGCQIFRPRAVLCSSDRQRHGFGRRPAKSATDNTSQRKMAAENRWLSQPWLYLQWPMGSTNDLGQRPAFAGSDRNYGMPILLGFAATQTAALPQSRAMVQQGELGRRLVHHLSSSSRGKFE